MPLASVTARRMADSFFAPSLSTENNDFQLGETGRRRGEFRVEKILLGIMPFGRWFKSEMAADRFKPIGFGQRVIHQAEAKRLKL